MIPDSPRSQKSRTPDGSPPPSRSTLGKAFPFGVIGFVIMGSVTLYELLAPIGLDLPEEPTPEQPVPGCTCKLADAHTVTLGVQVVSAMPGQWNLAWVARHDGGVLPLLGGAPASTVTEDADLRLRVACVGNDRLLVASRNNVTLYSLVERRILWDRATQYDLGTRTFGAACDGPTRVFDDRVEIVGSKTQRWFVRLRLADGADMD